LESEKVETTGEERVIAALDFRETDRVPHFDLYWGSFAQRWRRVRGLPTNHQAEEADPAEDEELNAYYDVDMALCIADESPWPSQVGLLRTDGEYEIHRDGWGRLLRQRKGAYFFEELQTPLEDKTALDRMVFDSPSDEARYVDFLRKIDQSRHRAIRPFIFCKVGGPYLRSSFLRGQEQWLMDLIEDPGFVHALAERVADHLIAVGLESLRRGNLWHTAIAIYDDIAGNNGLIMGPHFYRRFFLPATARMVAAFKRAGVQKVMFHSDGDIRAILSDLIDIGVDAINPVEPRAHMHATELRRQFDGKLAIVGGLCNSLILPTGTQEDVRRHILDVLQAGEGGGLVIGSHTIAPDISQERYDYVMSLLRRYWHYPLRFP
jgi:uroporphyrinogen decarboxylase